MKVVVNLNLARDKNQVVSNLIDHVVVYIIDILYERNEVVILKDVVYKTKVGTSYDHFHRVTDITFLGLKV